jgi:hypothetical protein
MTYLALVPIMVKSLSRMIVLAALYDTTGRSDDTRTHFIIWTAANSLVSHLTTRSGRPHFRCHLSSPFRYRSIYPTPTSVSAASSTSATRRHAAGSTLHTGFSTRSAQRGNNLTACISRSWPGTSVPRANGGTPRMARLLWWQAQRSDLVS